MLYPKSKDKVLSDQLFRQPTAEYRGTPFWSWNGELNQELLSKEIESLKEMGFGGFHMHPRVGLATPYLSDEFMDRVRDCVQKAKDENMLAWLYDEDRWPSGFAGGFNTQKEENRAKHVFFTKIPYDDSYLSLESDRKIAVQNVHKAKYSLLACFDLLFDENRRMMSYRRIGASDTAAGEKWFLYLETAECSAYYGGYTDCDRLKKSAIEDFIRITHERYKKAVGDEFGKTVPAIFCDEPNYTSSEAMTYPDETGMKTAFTDDFDDTFRQEYGYSIVDCFPEIAFEFSDCHLSKARYDYHNHLTDRFVTAYADTIGKWCEENHILMTGHLFREPSLAGQTSAVGDTMRSYRSFTLPGIDMLSDKHELSCAKQCQSSVRQYGREGMTSELYGVTTWAFDFKGHKQQGDWQAAMGVTVRVPHLFWMSMKGEAKRDYPASIGYQSPWYKEYRYIEDHFARVNTVMTRGTPVVHIGIIHPVESYWLYYGPYSQTNLKRRELANRYYELINWMLFGSLDFDMICEANLPSQYNDTEDGFQVGCENYKIVIVPGLTTIRSTTLELLEKFWARGGCILFMGEVPSYVDAVPSDRARRLAEQCTRIGWSRSALFEKAEPVRDIRILDGSGEYASNLTYNMRTDGDLRHVFIAHVTEPKYYEYDSSGPEKYVITLKGTWKVTLLNTLNGTKQKVKVNYVQDNTVLNWICYCCDSLLLEMAPGTDEEGCMLCPGTFMEYLPLEESCSYTLDEPNVLLLDMPKYSIGNSELKGPEEVLRIQKEVTKTLGIQGARMQPWLQPRSTAPLGKVRLVYEIESEIFCTDVRLALENLPFSKVWLNGKICDCTDIGGYVDEDAIRVICVGDILQGKNILEIEIDFNEQVYIESCYLLGNFGVRAEGSKAVITKLPEKLHFGSVTGQGLAFYSGNITYHLHYTGSGEKSLLVQRFCGAAMSVAVDGKRVPGMLAFPPNTLRLGELENGEHTLDVTLYGNRWNTFGPLHDCVRHDHFPGPQVYKRDDRWFGKEYMLRDNGIMTTPLITEEK